MTGPENFTKMPNHILEWMGMIDLNGTQFRIMNAVIRHTFGYHRRWSHFTQSFLSDLTNCNQRQIARELKVMVSRGILLQRFEQGKRMLCINEKIAAKNDQDDDGYDYLDIPSYDELDIGSYVGLDTHIKKDIKERYKEKRYLPLSGQDHIFIKIYLYHFKRVMKRDHMEVREDKYESIMDDVKDWSDAMEVTPDEWEEAVIEHFDNLTEGNNGNIIAFLRAARRYFIG